MVNWGALIEAPVGVMLLYVSLVMYSAVQVPAFGILSNGELFPFGGATKIIISLIPLMLGVMLLYSAYRAFREPEQPYGYQ